MNAVRKNSLDGYRDLRPSSFEGGDMGWIIVLVGVVILVLIVRKTLDRETTRNLKFHAKIVAAVVGLIVLWGFLSFAIH